MRQVDSLGRFKSKDPKFASFKSYYRVYKDAAVLRNFAFELSFDEFVSLVKQDCHYCGSEPRRWNKYTSRNGRMIRANGRAIATEDTASKAWIMVSGLDRKNNEEGYTTSNVVSCCTICNHAKHNLPYESFIDYLKRLCDYRKNL